MRANIKKKTDHFLIKTKKIKTILNNQFNNPINEWTYFRRYDELKESSQQCYKTIEIL